MSDEWDGKVVMSAPGGPIVTMSLGDLLARKDAEIERLFNEDTKTRHALKGWALVCPDGGDEPTHERVAAVVAEVEKQRAEIERLRENVDRLGKEVERADRLREEIARLKSDNRYLVKRALEGKP